MRFAIMDQCPDGRPHAFGRARDEQRAEVTTDPASKNTISPVAGTEVGGRDREFR
jgi:hypothetical protein